MDACGLEDEVLAIARRSVHWPGLVGALQEADNRGLKPEEALAALSPPTGQSGRNGVPPRCCAGLVPRAEGIADADMARAIRECEQAIACRARELAEEALAADAPWARPLGRPPGDPAARAGIIEHVAVVAAYRDRWDIGPDSVLGDVGCVSPATACPRNRARRAGQEATRMTGVARERTTRSELTPPRELDVRLQL